MPTNNFIQFNSNKNNMMDDTTYAKQAPLGIVDKLFYQNSTFIKAFAEFMNKYGIDANDNDLSGLSESIENSIKEYIKQEILCALTPSNSNFVIQNDELDINLLLPEYFSNGVQLGFDQKGYIIFGSPYGKFTIQHGYFYVDTKGHAKELIKKTIQFPIAYKYLLGVYLIYRDTALSTNNQEDVCYLIDSAASNSSTQFGMINYSNYESGYNCFHWMSIGYI